MKVVDYFSTAKMGMFSGVEEDRQRRVTSIKT